jgi:hypothetical protein
MPGARPGLAGTLPGHRAQPLGGASAVWDVAALEALAECLNRLGLPSLALPGTVPPCVDVGLPGDMAPGERVYLHEGMFVWHRQRVGRADRPAAAADVMARALCSDVTARAQRR